MREGGRTLEGRFLVAYFARPPKLGERSEALANVPVWTKGLCEIFGRFYAW